MTTPTTTPPDEFPPSPNAAGGLWLVNPTTLEQTPVEIDLPSDDE